MGCTAYGHAAGGGHCRGSNGQPHSYPEHCDQDLCQPVLDTMVIMNILAKTFVSLCSACQSTVSSVCDSILECGKLQTLQCNAMCAVVRPCCFRGPAVVKPAHQTALHGCHIMCKSCCLQHLSQTVPPPSPHPSSFKFCSTAS